MESLYSTILIIAHIFLESVCRVSTIQIPVSIVTIESNNKSEGAQ